MENLATQKIASVKVEGDVLIIFAGQISYRWNMSEVSIKLSQASETEKNDFKISPSGYGIHWPQIDEDLSLYGLLNTLK